MKVDTKAARARADAATPGPWRYDDGHVFCGPLSDARHEECRRNVEREKSARVIVRRDLRESVADCPQDNPDVSANEEFIAAARTDVTALCDRVEALEAALREIERMAISPATGAPYSGMTGIHDRARRALEDQ